MVPNGWKYRTISEILTKVVVPVDVDTSSYYREIGIRSHGKGIFHKELILGKELGNKRVFHVEPECFVVNIVFAWEQAVAKTTDAELGMIASHRFPMFKPKNGCSDIDFILYFFKTKKGKFLLELASPGGAGRNKTLGQSEFSKLSILLPPTSEQKKIAQILITWDKAITTTEHLLANSQQQKKAIMQHLLTGKKRLLDKNGIKFSGGWKKRALGDLGDTFNGLTGKTKEDFGFGKKYIPYINIFKNSRIDLDALDLVDLKEGESQSLTQFGDIFFTTSSETPNEVGMSSVLLDHVDQVYLNSFCFGFRLFDFESLLPEFARYLLRSENVRSEIAVLGQGATRYNLSKKQLMKLELELPDVDEQQKISAVLSTNDQEISALQQKLDALKQEKKALMQQLLTGKRRVLV